MVSGLMIEGEALWDGVGNKFLVMDQLRGRPMFTGIPAVLPLPQELTLGPPL